jgi:glutathione S-transferase
VHFEYGTKRRYHLSAFDQSKVTEGLAAFHEHAALLNDHLAGRDYLLTSGLSYADFRMATYLPFNDVANLPLADYPQIAAWNARMMLIPAWSDPFAGLDAPALTPVNF